jgi:hypothetical protein
MRACGGRITWGSADLKPATDVAPRSADRARVAGSGDGDGGGLARYAARGRKRRSLIASPPGARRGARRPSAGPCDGTRWGARPGSSGATRQRIGGERLTGSSARASHGRLRTPGVRSPSIPCVTRHTARVMRAYSPSRPGACQGAARATIWRRPGVPNVMRDDDAVTRPTRRDSRGGRTGAPPGRPAERGADVARTDLRRRRCDSRSDPAEDAERRPVPGDGGTGPRASGTCAADAGGAVVRTPSLPAPLKRPGARERSGAPGRVPSSRGGRRCRPTSRRLTDILRSSSAARPRHGSEAQADRDRQ